MNGRSLIERAALPAVVAVALLASGCAALSADGGFGGVAGVAQDRLGKDARLLRNDADESALARLLAEKLRSTLSADDAVQIALLNHRGLQAAYWNIGIAEADLVKAGRLQNPAFGFQRTHQGAEVEIERSLTFNLVSVLTMPLAQRIEGRRFEQTRLMVANQMLQHAFDTRRAYFEAVAATQAVAYARQVSAAAAASAGLMDRMAQAGNSSQLDLARERSFEAEATAGVGRAAKRATAAREKLTRMMGLWGASAGYTLPDRLPALPPAPAVLDDVERVAIRERLDIQAARAETAQTASSLGLTRATRFINVLDLGYVRNSSTGQASAPGYAISLEIPLFDWGATHVAKSEAIYMQAAGKLAQVATDARSEARESYLDYRTSFDLALHYRDQVIPLRKKISDETLLRYNGMLISVFELLADSREQATAVNSYIDALKDFWIAQTNLEAALGGRLPAPAAQTSKGNTP